LYLSPGGIILNRYSRFVAYANFSFLHYPWTSLPVNSVLTEIRGALWDSGAGVLCAPPGSGKTTAVPLSLLNESWLGGRSILLVEPRRLAVRLAAVYMAGRLGEEAGKTVGYQVRFDRRISGSTRLEVVTEGILIRRLQGDPELTGVGLVIFDEFHERGLDNDLALALCLEMRNALREDLRLLVMSATMDPATVSGLMGGAPVITCRGRTYPVEVRYVPPPPRLSRGCNRSLACCPQNCYSRNMRENAEYRKIAEAGTADGQ
jgi:ATP-dependent helicase HrpB